MLFAEIRRLGAVLSLFGVVTAALLVPTTSWAQTTTAIISGVVSDVSGAVIAGASVEVRNVGTGRVQSATTDSEGRYRASEMLIGDYEVQVSQGGFQTVVRKGITLTVGSQTIVDFSLAIGQAQQTVTVEAQASQVDTTSSAVANLVEQKQMSELPLNGRNFTQLITLAPGVQALPANGGSFYGRQDNFSVSGSRPVGQFILLDNTNLQTFFGHGTGSGATGSSLGVEAIAEFQTLTNTYSAQFGGNGAVVNAVTKSGGNAVHGSLFGFERNSFFDARNFFDNYRRPGETFARVPAFRRHQFGGSVGGPIQRDKMFFFMTYEGIRQSQGQTSIANVPDANAKLGFLPCATAPTSPCNAATGLANVGLAPAVAPVMALYPTATTVIGGGIGTFPAVANLVTGQNYLLSRYDYNISSKDSIFVRWVRDRASFKTPFSGSLVPLYLEKDSTANDFVTLEERRLVSQNIVNQARISFLRPIERAEQISPSLPAMRFFPGRDDGRITVTGLSGIGPFMLVPYRLIVNQWMLGDDVNYIRGSHNLKFGINVQRIQNNTSSPQALGGTFAFQSLLNFMQGTANTLAAPLQGRTDATRDIRELFITPYIHDEWKATRKLTMNLGLRYELGNNPTERLDRFTNLTDFARNTSFVSVPNAFITNPTKGNWAPRVGFAFDPSKDHKTSIRGGFGMFYDLMTAKVYAPAYWLAPPFASATQTNPSFPLPFPATSVAPPLPTANQGLFFGTSNTPYIMQYNLNVQRQLAQGTVLTAGYVGSKGVHLLGTRDYNPPVPTIAADGGRVFGNLVNGRIVTNPRINPGFGFLQMRAPWGTSNYNALQAGLNRRFSNGVQLQAAYTYSKSIDYGSAGQGAENVGGVQATLDPYSTANERGRSTFDRTHSLRMNGVYALPFRGNILIEGWRLSGIFSRVTGAPFTILTGFDQAGLGIGNSQRPNLVAGRSGNPIVGTVEQWYDPAAFSAPTVGRYGNLGRNTVVGPGLTNMDLSLAKDTRVPSISEAFAVQFRAEVFNIANHANFGQPVNSVFVQGVNGGANSNPNAARIQGAGAGRQVQFGLKFVF